MSTGRAVVELEVPALLRGAGLALAVGGLAAVVAALLDAVDDRSPLAFPLLLVALAGLAAGGWVAARACARNPLTHAALAALAAVGVLLAVDAARRLASGDDVRWAYLGVWGLLALACGLAGGLAALHRRPFRPRPPRREGPDAARTGDRADSGA